MKWLSDYLDSVWQWFLTVFKAFWQAFTDFALDLPVKVLDLLLTGVAAVVNAIPVPSFVAGGGLQHAYSALPGWMQYFLSVANMGAALSVIGAGVAFRLARKLITLGQW